MPRFHFNIFDGISDLDRTGTELPDWREARLEAIRRAGAIFRDTPKTLALGEEWRMEITDQKGLVLFRLDFSVLQAPAVGGTAWKQSDPA